MYWSNTEVMPDFVEKENSFAILRGGKTTTTNILDDSNDEKLQNNDQSSKETAKTLSASIDDFYYWHTLPEQFQTGGCRERIVSRNLKSGEENEDDEIVDNKSSDTEAVSEVKQDDFKNSNTKTKSCTWSVHPTESKLTPRVVDYQSEFYENNAVDKITLREECQILKVGVHANSSVEVQGMDFCTDHKIDRLVPGNNKGLYALWQPARDESEPFQYGNGIKRHDCLSIIDVNNVDACTKTVAVYRHHLTHFDAKTNSLVREIKK